jgi:hypothetical protein
MKQISSVGIFVGTAPESFRILPQLSASNGKRLSFSV